MYVGDIDTHLIILLGLYTTGEGHRLGLNTTEWREGCDGLHTFIGGVDNWEAAIRIIGKLLHGSTATKTAAIRKLSRVIEEIGMAKVVGYAAMIGERLGVAQRHNLATIGPGTFGRRS